MRRRPHFYRSDSRGEWPLRPRERRIVLPDRVVPQLVIPISLPLVLPVPRPSATILSPRQHECLLLIAGSRNTKQIATEMKIRESTVSSTRIALMDRLGIYDVAGLVRYVIAHGWEIP